MIGTRTKASVAKWHRWLGLGLTVPLIGWIVSSAAMMLVTMNAEQGLAGVYELEPYNSVDIALDEAVISPAEILGRMESEFGVENVYWLRLESRGAHLLYVVKPTPYALAKVFDARSGRLLDPLPDDLLLLTANESLVGTHAVQLDHVEERNRYYDSEKIPAVRVAMAGQQPGWLFLSRDEGRTLRRLNGDSRQFTWWYETFHVNQWGDSRMFWTIMLYVLSASVVVLATFGLQLFWWRRKRVVPIAKVQRFRTRTLHRYLGGFVGVMLILQVAVGSYLWLNLGPLEDPFRGKGSFNPDWNAGISTAVELEDVHQVLARISPRLDPGPRPLQSLEWRNIDGATAVVAQARRDDRGIAFDAATGEQISPLSPETAARIAQQDVLGTPAFEIRGERADYWMDVNRSVPTYQLRFADPHETDVMVSPVDGQIIQRRPAMWRAFGPYLRLHMFSFTRQAGVDMALLAIFQFGVLALIVSGWTLQIQMMRGNRRAKEATPTGAERVTAPV